MKLAAVLVISCAVGWCQPQNRVQFEVATVKRSAPPEGDLIYINLGRALNGKVELGNATLTDCLKFAYGLVSDAQIGGPDWIKQGPVRFDIVGQAAPETPREQLLVMLQNLLAERLNVAIHREPRAVSHLELVPGKGKPNLPPSTVEANGAAQTTYGGKIISKRMSMQTFTMLVSRFERQTVIDRTGLAGFYEIHLEWTPENIRTLPLRPDGTPAQLNGISADGPSIYTAIQEQLGLKLQTAKGPIEVLVVDRADQTPAAN